MLGWTSRAVEHRADDREVDVGRVHRAADADLHDLRALDLADRHDVARARRAGRRAARARRGRSPRPRRTPRRGPRRARRSPRSRRCAPSHSRVRSSDGNTAVVPPSSTIMLAIVPRSLTDSVATPSPWNSKIAPDAAADVAAAQQLEDHVLRLHPVAAAGRAARRRRRAARRARTGGPPSPRRSRGRRCRSRACPAAPAVDVWESAPTSSLARRGEALEVHVVADAVAGLGVLDAVPAAERLQVVVVVHVALVDLEHVVVDVDDRQRDGRALDAELLELQRGHRARRVLDQHLVDAQPELARPARASRSRGASSISFAVSVRGASMSHPGRASTPGGSAPPGAVARAAPRASARPRRRPRRRRPSRRPRAPAPRRDPPWRGCRSRPGRTGSRPAPPTEDSNSVAPASSAASALATAVLRVSCRCTPYGARARPPARMPRFTWLGTAMPIVSASISSAAPRAGHPRQQVVDHARVDLALERAAERDAHRAGDGRALGDGALDQRVRRLGRLVARAVDVRAREALRRHDGDVHAAHARRERAVEPARVEHEGGDVGLRRRRPSSARRTSSAPAICGTRSSRTKLTASMRRRPAPARRPHSSARVAGGSALPSFCSPSRGPTSHSAIAVT